MINIKDDFDATREALLQWVRELDTNTRQSGYKDKEISLVMDSLQKTEYNLEQNQHRFDYIDKAGAYLIQKCEASDAVQIQRDVDEFHDRVQALHERINKYKEKLEKRSQQQVKHSRIACL